MKFNFKNDGVLEFNNKRSCGLWLILIGFVFIISIACGGDFLLNPLIFLFGYYICFYIALINKKVKSKLSCGKMSLFQITMLRVSLIVLFVLLFALAGSFIPGWHWRLIWLGVMLATAIHFLPLFYVHGKSMILLSLCLIIIAAAGYIFSSIPFFYFGLANSAVMILFGLYLLFFSKPTKIIMKKKKVN